MSKQDTLVTREHYIEMLIDSSFQEASEMEKGFASWCERHVPTWRELGHDEMWIRQRVASAQANRRLHRTLKAQGCGMLEIRAVLRESFAKSPTLYDLALEHEPDLLRYRGNTSDLRQRYTLRVLLYESDKLSYEKLCRGQNQPDEVFNESPDSARVVRDLSTVEELETLLILSRYLYQLLDEPGKYSKDEIVTLMEARGQQLRAVFLERYGYPPEESAISYVPVTIDGPQDHDEYFAREYPEGV